MADTRTKSATQLIVDDYVKNTAARLAIVRGQSMAEVWRAAISRGIDNLANAHAEQLLELAEALENMGFKTTVAQDNAVQEMLSQRIKFSDLFDVNGRPLDEFPGEL